MFTFEIRINGSLIGHVYGHNEGYDNDKDLLKQVCLYSYEYYRPENKKIICGKVKHDRDAGIEPLLISILKDVEGKIKI